MNNILFLGDHVPGVSISKNEVNVLGEKTALGISFDAYSENELWELGIVKRGNGFVKISTGEKMDFNNEDGIFEPDFYKDGILTTSKNAIRVIIGMNKAEFQLLQKINEMNLAVEKIRRLRECLINDNEDENSVNNFNHFVGNVAFLFDLKVQS